MLTNCRGEMIDRAIVVANKHASHANRVKRQLRHLDLPQEVIETKKDPRYLRDELLKRAATNKLIFGAGGDGTQHTIGNILMSAEAHEVGLHWQPFIPLRGGNANDLAHMLNGRRGPAAILKQGSHTWLQPLEVIIDDNEGNRAIRYALGYFAVGATARAAQRMDDIKNTANWLSRLTGFQKLREPLAAWHSVATTPVYMSREREGRLLHPVADQLFLRGDRIAKYGHPHATLEKPLFEQITSGRQNHARALADMLRLQRGNLYGTVGDQVSFRIEPATDIPEKLYQMYDGEAALINYGSTVTVNIADEAWHTLATEL